MNDKNRDSLIGQEGFKILLEEFTREQEVHNKSMKELITTIRDLSQKVAELEGKTKKSEPIKVNVDSTSIEQIIKKGITDIKIMAAAKPQPIVKKYQLLLFPEWAYPAFQKIFLGRWIIFVTAIFFVFCSYKFGIHWNDNRQKIKLEQVGNTRILKAWEDMYEHGNDKTIRMMDEAYKNTKNHK